MKKTFAIAIIALIAACSGGVQHPHPHVPNDTPKCADACKHLQELGCDEGKPLADGTSCTDFCTRTQDSGHALTPSCVVRINRCSDMENLDAFCPSGVQRP